MSGHICAYVALFCRANAPPPSARNTSTAASAAVNRPGSSAPAANPRAQHVATPAAPTATGHQSGPPQWACSAVTPYTTATPPRYTASAHQVAAAHMVSWPAHRGTAVTPTRSVRPRRPSRDPIQAVAPASSGPRNSTACCRSVARTFQNGGLAMAGR